jgi:hypothetical protein
MPDHTDQPRYETLIQRGLVPYIVTWSTEQTATPQVITNRRGISYTDETFADRDSHGVLWTRCPSRPGHGRPLFGQVHPLRQRRAMRRLLCQVCGRPADHNTDGTLWILKDHRHDWPHWPNQMAVTEPPICQPCAHTSARHCPALRKVHVTIRVKTSTVAGVLGIHYRPGSPLLAPQPTDDTITYDDPAIRWVRATQLVRELHDSTLVDLENSPGTSPVRHQYLARHGGNARAVQLPWAPEATLCATKN